MTFFDILSVFFSVYVLTFGEILFSGKFREGLSKILINKVEICGVNTSKLPYLNEKQKQELFQRIKKGDKNARQEFIYGNLRLVLSVLQRFGGKNENVDDLFQVGCIGLIKALDNFDTSHGVKFSTYAVPMSVRWGNYILNL